MIRGAGFFSYFPSLLLDLYWRDILDSPLFDQTILPETFVRGLFLLPYLVLAVFVGRLGLWHRSAATKGADAAVTARRRCSSTYASSLLET